MKKTRAATITLLVAPLFFVLHGWHQHYGPVEAGDAAQVWALLAAGAFLLAALLWIPVRRRFDVAGGGALIAFLLFSFWGYFYDRVSALYAPALLPRIPLLAGILAGVGGVAWWGFCRLSAARRGRLLQFSALLFSTLATLDGALLLRRHLAARHDFAALPSAAIAAPGPNFYLLLFDEWASPEALRRDLGYDMGGTGQFLTDQGFHLLRGTRSNYSQTVFSMASMLNGAYLPGRVTGSPVRPQDYNDCQRWINDARIPAAFRDAGYRLVNLSIFRIQDSAPRVGAPFFPRGTGLLLSSTFYGRVIRHQLTEKGGTSPARHHPYYDALYNQDSVLQHLSRLSSAPSEKRFVYAHFFTPHWPFYFDTAGRLLSVEAAMKATQANAPSSYRAALPHAETVLRRAVQTIMQQEEGRAVILVMGDHGYRNTTLPGNDTAAFQALAAVYFPDRDYRSLPHGISHVNVVRTAVGRMLGIPLRTLPDSCVILGEDAQPAW